MAIKQKTFREGSTMNKRRARITIQTERLLVISRSSNRVEAWCDCCRAKRSMVAIDEAVVITGLTQRALFRLADAAEIHFTETEVGRTLFCIGSLNQLRTPNDINNR